METDQKNDGKAQKCRLFVVTFENLLLAELVKQSDLKSLHRQKRTLRNNKTRRNVLCSTIQESPLELPNNLTTKWNKLQDAISLGATIRVLVLKWTKM